MATCYKVLRRDVIQLETTVKVARHKLRIYEVGISYSGRTYEEGEKIGWKDGFRALYCLVKYSLSEQRVTTAIAGDARAANQPSRSR